MIWDVFAHDLPLIGSCEYWLLQVKHVNNSLKPGLMLSNYEIWSGGLFNVEKKSIILCHYPEVFYIGKLFSNKMIHNQSLVDLDTSGIVSHIELSVYENKVRRRLHVPLTSPFLWAAPLIFLTLHINGTKEKNVDGTCKHVNEASMHEETEECVCLDVCVMAINFQ